MDNISIGRYVPFNTVVHKLDARNKIVCLILLMVSVFISFEIWAMEFLFSGLMLVITIVLMIISKTSLKELFKSLRFMWFMILFLLIINVCLPPRKEGVEYIVAFSIGNFNVYWQSIFQSIKIVFRLINMLGITMVLTSSTKPLDLTNAFEWYMTPLKVIKFPAHQIAMTISIALRFIPTLLDETARLIKAQTSRGIDFEKGSIKVKFKGIISLIIPLFVSAFLRSEELANAMEARGYDPNAKRTHYHSLKFAWKDLFSFLFVALLCAFVIFSSVSHINYFELLNINLPEVVMYGYYLG